MCVKFMMCFLLFKGVNYDSICMCSGARYGITPFHTTSSYGLAQGSKGESVYPPLCQHMTSRECIPQLVHLAVVWEKSPSPDWLCLILSASGNVLYKINSFILTFQVELCFFLHQGLIIRHMPPVF